MNGDTPSFPGAEQVAGPAPAPRLEISAPKLFRTGAMLAVGGYGFLLMFPVLVSLLAVSVLPFGVWTWLLPVLALAAATLLLPFGFGNPYVKKLARSIQPTASSSQGSFLVQVTFHPRLNSGLRARVEDADDIGWLRFTDNALVFQGDAVNLTVPFERIQNVKAHTIGLRGVYLYPCVTVAVAGLTGVNTLTFAERSAWIITTARILSRRLCRELSDKLAARSAGRS